MRLLGATRPPSRRLPVVLDPLVTRSLLALLGARAVGRGDAEGRSMFVGREGEDVAAPGITLVDDPTLAEAFGAATHDAEGVPTRRVELIAGGRLDAFLHNVLHRAPRRHARRTGSAVRGGFKSPPGVGARALHLVPGELSAEEILASVPEALYVQSVSGLHSGTNPVSGDFSVGAEGLMVRGGELAEPVREVTIASTLQRMLHDIVARRRRPQVAPRRRRGHDAAPRRDVGQRRLTRTAPIVLAWQTRDIAGSATPNRQVAAASASRRATIAPRWRRPPLRCTIGRRERHRSASGSRSAVAAVGVANESQRPVWCP